MSKACIKIWIFFLYPIRKLKLILNSMNLRYMLLLIIFSVSKYLNSEFNIFSLFGNLD